MTLKHLFEPPVTVQYPEERWRPAHGFRGIPVSPIDEETGELKCVGCQACARACPPQVIHIETSRKDDPDDRKKLNIDEFSIDMSRCMLCNLCVEACPFEAITMSDHYEMADYELEGIVFDKEELVEAVQAHQHGHGPRRATAGRRTSPRIRSRMSKDTPGATTRRRKVFEEAVKYLEARASKSPFTALAPSAGSTWAGPTTGGACGCPSGASCRSPQRRKQSRARAQTDAPPIGGLLRGPQALPIDLAPDDIDAPDEGHQVGHMQARERASGACRLEKEGARHLAGRLIGPVADEKQPRSPRGDSTWA